MTDEKPGFFRIKNFEKFQHYKNKQPKWIKLYTSLLDDFAFSSLSEAGRFHLIGIWLLAARNGNRLPCDSRALKVRLCSASNVDLKSLFASGFIIQIDEEENSRESIETLYKKSILETEIEIETETDPPLPPPVPGGEGAVEAKKPKAEKTGKQSFAEKNFAEDWAEYPVKGNRKAAFRHYCKTVTTPEKREAFLARTAAYIAEYRAKDWNLKKGDAWFNQWLDFEPTPRSGSGHQPKLVTPPPLTFDGPIVTPEEMRRARMGMRTGPGNGPKPPEICPPDAVSGAGNPLPPETGVTASSGQKNGLFDEMAE